MTSPPSSVFFIFLLLTLLLTVSRDHDLEEDKKALEKFKENIQYDRSKINWDTEQEVCKWTGVTCQLGTVSYLHLRAKSLKGSIPQDSLGKITSLRVLSLGSKMLSGQFPADFADLREMRNVYLQDNQFSGEFPSSVAKWTKLLALDLSGNNFTGTVPHDLANVANLRIVYLQNNKFSGQFPSSVAHWTELLVLDLSGNNFTGTVPDDLANLTELRSVYLQNNKFSGKFPSSVAHWTELLALDLSGNNFHGRLPNNLPSSIKSEDFSVSNNNFIGPIPENLSSKFPAAFSGNIYLCQYPNLRKPFNPRMKSPYIPRCQDTVISQQSQSPLDSPSLNHKKEEKLCTGAIVVIAIGSALILLLLLSYLRKEWSRAVKEKNAPGVATMAAKAAARGFGKLD